MRTVVAIMLAGSALLAKDAAPQWVREAANTAVKPDYPAKVSNVVLLNEEHLTVTPDGKWITTERGVIKILQAGRRTPEAWKDYNTKTGRIRDFRAWLLLPSGKETEFPKSRILDVALSTEFTYDEGRAKLLECDKDAPAGSVFAYEVTEEEDTVFTTYPYSFQESDEPVAVSRFVLSLPAGWEVRSKTFNHGDIAPQASGGSYIWELRDLPWIEDEEYRPRYRAIAPRIGVTFLPAQGAALTALKDWQALSQWMSTLVEPAAEPAGPVRAKAEEITKGLDSELARIRAIAAFAQQTNYVAVDLNVMKGGGYTPHLAAQVLARNYGDCKDKSALMRALLKAVGIDSYAVMIYSGDRQAVRPEWPSPHQFNHAIVAVKVSADTKLPSVLEHPKLGRLLIFDPTDPVTPVGGLPADEQNSYALVIAGADGELLKMPQLPIEANRVERRVDAHLDASGQLSAHVLIQYYGESASITRYAIRHQSADELRRSLEKSFSRRLGHLTLDKITPTDYSDENRMDLAVDLSLTQFGQFMQDKMLLLRPGLLAPDPDYIFTTKQRKLPVRLSPLARKEFVAIQFPSGFAVDEMSEPAVLAGPYGAYAASWKNANGVLTFEQSLETKDVVAPASEYGKVKDFFDTVAGAQAATVVLLKK